MKVLVKTISHNEPREVELAAPLVVELRSKVAEVCYEIASEDSHRVRLIFKGRVLEDTKYLHDYGINDGDIVHAVIRPVLQSSSTNNSAAASTNTTNPTSSSTAQQTDTRAPQASVFMDSSASNELPRMPQIPNISGINFEQVADNVFMGSMSLDISDPNMDQSTLLNVISNAISGPLPRNSSSSNNGTNNGTNTSNNNNANRSSSNQNVFGNARERIRFVSESNNNDTNNNHNASNGNSSHLSPAMRQLISTFQSFLSSIIIILRDMQRENANIAQVQTMLNLISSQAILLSSIMSVTQSNTPVAPPPPPQQQHYPLCPPYLPYPTYPTPYYYHPFGYPAQYNMFAHPQPTNLQNQSDPLNNAPSPLQPPPQFTGPVPWAQQTNPLSSSPDARLFSWPPNEFSSLPTTQNAIPVTPVPIVQPNAAVNNDNDSESQQNVSNQATNSGNRIPAASDILNADAINSLDQTLNVAVSAISSAFGGSDNTSNAISGLLSNIIGPNGVINSSNIRRFSRNVARANNRSSADATEPNEDDDIGFD